MDLIEAFRTAIEEVVGEVAVEPTRDTPIFELDIDSLTLIEVIMVLEDDLGVETTQDDFKSVVTVGDALDLFASLVEAA